MSYILDALQRADAERERGHVPGLRSQIVPPANRKAARLRRWQPWHTITLLVALLTGAGWWWSLDTEDVPSAAPASAAPPAAASAETADASTPAMRPAPPPPEQPVQPILAPPRVEPPKRPAANTPATPPAVAAAPAPAPGAAPPAAAAPPVPSPATTTASEPTAGPVRSFAELSPEARAQLPAVNVSGSTYSRNPALRMLIVNGKVMQEGQEIAPGLKLETIGQRNAVLNHNGLRYSIGY
jgi:general secretion pathway protein B